MKKWIHRAVPLTIAVSMMVPLLAACSKGQGNTDTKTERVLRIATSMGFGDDDYFRQQFTEVFEFANPNIKIEMVQTMDDKYRYGYGRMAPGEKMPDPLEQLKKAMEGDNPPDVVMVNYEQLNDLVSSNLLTQLDPKIAQDKFDVSDYVPAVIDGIKKQGDGKLYALSPTFYSSALIYNKKMFDEAGVPYPKDGMTWDETFDLARRVAKGEGDNRKYGFAFSPYSGGDLFYSMDIYTAPLQLRVFDDKGEKMTVDSDQWEKVWKTMVQLNNEKIMPPVQDPRQMKERMMSTNPEDFNPFQHDDFLSSRVAMTIIGYGQIDQIVNANKSAANIKGFTPIDWNVVSLPTHQEAPGVGGYIGMNGIMGINAKAQNPDDAWKFIKFINGEDWARLKSKSNQQLVSRKKYLKPKDGLDFNIEAFAKLAPANRQDDYKIYREKQNIYQVRDIGRNVFQEVLQGKTGARDALKKWQSQGDAALQQLKDNPNAQIDMGAATAVPIAK
ncbi:ABC transporter substrate-binding protein [Paenibacillus hamazuiensis]|uniref:ABC transporter substrate-binding protein n=1 Tax=Paenibacillus hamazuiensis TaxID=2936508 RepID=UPI00201099F8|nr:sugar ABC transporter substrate-binding protein [Paenibacillus hamazuiensis]